MTKYPVDENGNLVACKDCDQRTDDCHEHCPYNPASGGLNDIVEYVEV